MLIGVKRRRRRRSLLKNQPFPQQTTTIFSPPDAQFKEQRLESAEPEDSQDSSKTRATQAIVGVFNVTSKAPKRGIAIPVAAKPFETWATLIGDNPIVAVEEAQTKSDNTTTESHVEPSGKQEERVLDRSRETWWETDTSARRCCSR